MHFLTPLRVILKHTFFPLAQRTPTFNMIKSYYLRNAVTPSDVGYRMAYEKCLMSYGDLRIPEEVTANWNPGQPVQVSWNPQVTQAMAQADDVLFAVVYLFGHKESWNYYIRQDIELNEYYCKLLT